jgi:hypothetical protein
VDRKRKVDRRRKGEESEGPNHRSERDHGGDPNGHPASRPRLRDRVGSLDTQGMQQFTLVRGHADLGSLDTQGL